MTYSGPVIDTHHHIWLRKDVGWLADPPIPRMFGDYFGIRRDYPVEEFINDDAAIREKVKSYFLVIYLQVRKKSTDSTSVSTFRDDAASQSSSANGHA